MILQRWGRETFLCEFAKIIIPIKRSKLLNVLSFLRIFFGGNPEVSDRDIQGETESHSHGGEKASPVVINCWQIGIQQKALGEKQALFCKYNTRRLFRKPEAKRQTFSEISSNDADIRK